MAANRPPPPDLINDPEAIMALLDDIRHGGVRGLMQRMAAMQQRDPNHPTLLQVRAVQASNRWREPWRQAVAAGWAVVRAADEAADVRRARADQQRRGDLLEQAAREEANVFEVQRALDREFDRAEDERAAMEQMRLDAELHNAFAVDADEMNRRFRARERQQREDKARQTLDRWAAMAAIERDARSDAVAVPEPVAGDPNDFSDPFWDQFSSMGSAEAEALLDGGASAGAAAAGAAGGPAPAEAAGPSASPDDEPEGKGKAPDERGSGIQASRVARTRVRGRRSAVIHRSW